MTQYVIVYRNPIEAAFWESGLLFPLIVGCVVAICAAYVCSELWRRLWFKSLYMQGFTSHVALFTAIGSMIATMMYMV